MIKNEKESRGNGRVKQGKDWKTRKKTKEKFNITRKRQISIKKDMKWKRKELHWAVQKQEAVDKTISSRGPFSCCWLYHTIFLSRWSLHYFLLIQHFKELLNLFNLNKFNSMITGENPSAEEDLSRYNQKLQISN